MAECIIARGGGSSSGGGTVGPPVIPGMHTILTTVTDSAGIPIEDLSVHCKDGSAWYNYHTNEKGQVLFATNSGAANIIAWNFSLNGNYKYLDQETVTKDLDAPIGSTTTLNLSLIRVSGEQSFTAMQSNIYQPRTAGLFSGNCRVRVSTHANVFLGGGGGGGGWGVTDDDDSTMYGGAGGGGGGITIRNGVAISTSSNYQFFIGAGGSAGWCIPGSRQYVDGGTGGSTSAFGLSCTGGGGGKGGGGMIGTAGVAGTGDYSGGSAVASARNGNGQNSQWSNWGGGGGTCAWQSNFYGGRPGGGNSIMSNHGQAGINGGGGGAPGHAKHGGYRFNGNGGAGSVGKISFTLY